LSPAVEPSWRTAFRSRIFFTSPVGDVRPVLSDADVCSACGLTVASGYFPTSTSGGHAKLVSAGGEPARALLIRAVLNSKPDPLTPPLFSAPFPLALSCFFPCGRGFSRLSLSYRFLFLRSPPFPPSDGVLLATTSVFVFFSRVVRPPPFLNQHGHIRSRSSFLPRDTRCLFPSTSRPRPFFRRTPAQRRLATAASPSSSILLY